MVKDVISGKADSAIGLHFRQHLFKTNADYDEVWKYGHFLTSKGRHYRKT